MRLAAAAVVALAAAVQAPSPVLVVRLSEAESRVYPPYFERVQLYHLEIGDVGPERRLAEAEAKERFMGVYRPVAENAAQYVRKPDGAWRVRDFRRPTRAQARDFEEYMARPAAPGRPTFSEFLVNPWEKDFGEPGEFAYQRASIPQSRLPFPFSKVPPAALERVESLWQYHGSGGFLILLEAPYDEDGKIQIVRERLATEIRAAKP
ncbi:MAG: hypothetical protein HY078_07400 [Elusimicrobia bacterium]|nr:hypothetical protein [Elusimicrobiota bacterium]